MQRSETPDLILSAATLTTAMGRGCARNLSQLRAGRSALRPMDLPGIDLQTWIGRVDGIEDTSLAGELAAFDSRNTRLLEYGLQGDNFLAGCERVITRYGSRRVGLFVGTSTSGIQVAEAAWKRAAETSSLPEFDYLRSQNLDAAAAYLYSRLGLAGIKLTISTACSSSAKIFAAASRHIQAGLCDAAILVGVDSLCGMTLYGFHSLQLVSTRACRPADRARDGISIGEAMAGVILEPGKGPGVYLTGYGESSDAWHMSSPHPQGEGAVRAMRDALAMAGLAAADIDYVNLHGTGTQANDFAEDRAMSAVFADGIACSSTKGFCGHTLGAAGIVEVLICKLALEEGFYPLSINTEVPDPELDRPPLLRSPDRRVPRVAMTNSFGFGGTNASLILVRKEAGDD